MFGHEWVEVADQLGVPVVALKGNGQAGAKGAYGWHKGRNPNDLDVEGTAKMIDDAIKERGVDPAKVIIVGFSQGGAMAWQLMAEYPGKYRGALTIAGGDDIEVYRKWLANAKEATIRIFMIAGQLDNSRPNGPEVFAPIVDAGAMLRFELLPTVAHEMPEDATDLYVEAIEFFDPGWLGVGTNGATRCRHTFGEYGDQVCTGAQCNRGRTGW